MQQQVLLLLELLGCVSATAELRLGCVSTTVDAAMSAACRSSAEVEPPGGLPLRCDMDKMYARISEALLLVCFFICLFM